MTDQDRILWADVETTGLDSRSDRLLSIAVIMSDTEGAALADPVDLVIAYSSDEVEQMKSACSDVVRAMHDATGLWDRLTSPEAVPLTQVDDRIRELLDRHAPARRQARVGGNSVVLDLEFIRTFLPRTAEQLHYRFIDVTGIGTFLVWSGAVPERPASLPGMIHHNQLSDISQSLYEYQTLRHAVRSLAGLPDGHGTTEVSARPDAMSRRPFSRHAAPSPPSRAVPAITTHPHRLTGYTL